MPPSATSRIADKVQEVSRHPLAVYRTQNIVVVKFSFGVNLSRLRRT
jgi:hypothetical protein